MKSHEMFFVLSIFNCVCDVSLFCFVSKMNSAILNHSTFHGLNKDSFIHLNWTRHNVFFYKKNTFKIVINLIAHSKSFVKRKLQTMFK